MDQFETGQASVLVRDDSMKLWQITGEDLEEAASKNMPLLTPPVFKGMSEMMQEMLGMSVPGQDTPDSLYVLTNQQKCYGAVYMLDETVLAGISDQLGDAFFILPSSIHECMVLPCLPGFDPGRLAELVREVNRTQVDPQEVLSDSVYRYDRSACALQRVC